MLCHSYLYIHQS